MAGQSGAFLTIPFLVRVMHIPLRFAIGSSVCITFCAALAGSLGKLIGGGAFIWPHVTALLAGSLLGSQCSAVLRHRIPAVYLGRILAVLIGGCAVRMWYQLLV